MKWLFLVMNRTIETLHQVRIQPIYPFLFILQLDFLGPIQHFDLPFGKFQTELRPWESIFTFVDVEIGSFFDWER